METMKIKNAISVFMKSDVNGNPVYLVTGFDKNGFEVAFYTKSYILDPFSVSSYKWVEIDKPKKKRKKLWANIIKIGG